MATQKSRRQREQQQARAAAIQARKRRKEQRKKIGIIIFTAALLVLGVAAFVSGDGGGTNVETASDSTTPPASARPAVLTSVPPGATITGDTPCPANDGTAPRTTAFAKPPPMCIDPAKTYSAELTTSKGRFIIALDARAAPKTVNNFVVLARYKYFEGIPFHRIIPGFVVQGGDPLASGLGNPGYKFEDELPRPQSYKIGSVAMANSGANTNGSQFFIIVGDAGVSLQPNYSLFGTVTDGMDIVKSIEAVGTASGAPTQSIIISSVSIKES